MHSLRATVAEARPALFEGAGEGLDMGPSHLEYPEARLRAEGDEPLVQVPKA